MASLSAANATLLAETLVRAGPETASPGVVNVIVDRASRVELEAHDSANERFGRHLARLIEHTGAFSLRKKLYETLARGEEDPTHGQPCRPKLIIFDVRGVRDYRERQNVAWVAAEAACGFVSGHDDQEPYRFEEAAPPQIWLVCNSRPDFKDIDVIGIDQWRIWGVRDGAVGYADPRRKTWTARGPPPSPVAHE